MKIYSWPDLQEANLEDLPSSGGIIWLVFNSQNVSSDELKSLLKQWIGKEDINIINSPNGKPAFENSHWKFNLSHSGDFTALVLHPTQEVGIDLETWKPKSRLKPIVERYFFPEEVSLLGTIENDSEWESVALKMFTTKEALIKLKGGTLFRGLSEFNSLKPHSEIFFQTEVEGIFSLTITLA